MRGNLSVLVSLLVFWVSYFSNKVGQPWIIAITQQEQLPNQQLSKARFWKKLKPITTRNLKNNLGKNCRSKIDQIRNLEMELRHSRSCIEQYEMNPENWASCPMGKPSMLKWDFHYMELILSPVTRRKISKHEFPFHVLNKHACELNTYVNPVWRFVNSNGIYCM